jgi:opacity protein-like surface antigen
MRKLLMVAALVCLAPVVAMADDDPKAEVFVGYSYAHFDASVDTNGWEASVAGNVNDWFGIEADFSGHYYDGDAYLFLFGPKFAYREHDVVTPYAHVLFGGGHISVDDSSFDDTAFAMAVGGGLDAKVHDNVAIRIAQVDYVMTRWADDTQNGVRVSTGIVFRWD